MLPVPLFDAVLIVALIGIALRVLLAADLFQAIVLFIVFGLLMSLAWTRLHAVDVALAEAAIGAGLTGALFLNALAQSEHRDERAAAALMAWPSLARLPVLLLGAGGAILVGAGLVRASGDARDGISELVAASLAQSGVTNPVTAVLLNFRAYDTLLEIAVLVVTVAAVWGIGPAPAPLRGSSAPPGGVLLGLVRILIPLIGVVAGYLLWIGAAAPGGAFQAGAVLCAAGILLVVSGIAPAPTLRTWPERALVVGGFAAFLAVSIGVMARPGRFLEYPPQAASPLILLIETLLTISIAAILLALFAGGPQALPSGESSGSE